MTISVLIVLVTLAAACVGSFFLGLWVARQRHAKAVKQLGAAHRSQLAAATQIAAKQRDVSSRQIDALRTAGNEAQERHVRLMAIAATELKYAKRESDVLRFEIEGLKREAFASTRAAAFQVTR